MFFGVHDPYHRQVLVGEHASAEAYTAAPKRLLAPTRTSITGKSMEYALGPLGIPPTPKRVGTADAFLIDSSFGPMVTVR